MEPARVWCVLRPTHLLHKKISILDFKGGRIDDPLLFGRSVPDGPLDALDDPLESILRLFKSLAEASRVSPVGPYRPLALP